jgi:hypothetical protein
MILFFSSAIEAISKPSIGFKVTKDERFHPQEYIKYFEDWNHPANKEIKPEGMFKMVSK